MGSPCLFTRRKALKLGNFYCLRVINSNHLHTELSLCYLKHTKFYPENKAYFIQISSIASFKPFLLAWLWGCSLFRTVTNTLIRSYFPQKIMFCYQTCLFIICSSVECSQQIPEKKKINKNSGGHRDCFLTNCRDR